MIHFITVLEVLNCIAPSRVVEKGKATQRFLHSELLRQRSRQLSDIERELAEQEGPVELEELFFPARLWGNKSVHPDSFAKLQEVFGPSIGGPFVVRRREWRLFVLWLVDVLQEQKAPNEGIGPRIMERGLLRARDEDLLQHAYQMRDLHNEYWLNAGMW